MLRDALDAAGVDYVEAPGEAAFYGPKIDVQVVDPVERESTMSTIQLDFHQPAQFDLSYADASGGRSRPVMIHRSLVGSMERLFAYLIEAHGGAFPVWYSPVQVAVVPVSRCAGRRGARSSNAPPSWPGSASRSRPRARWEPGYVRPHCARFRTLPSSAPGRRPTVEWRCACATAGSSTRCRSAMPSR